MTRRAERSTPPFTTAPTRLFGAKLVAGILAVVVAWPSPGSAGTDDDTDGDGLPDHVEERTGTNPLRRDTDADGVPDGTEDRDRDGRVDLHESDPRQAGLFPGSYPHIPEPLVFDLVRGLGARKGELEANALALVNLREGSVDWAPEVEWAFADGYAVELELPTVNRELAALKLAFQGTLPNGQSSEFAHGWQTFGEVSLDDGVTDVVLLYMFGHRFARSWSYLTMLGGKSSVSDAGVSLEKGLLNSSLFFNANESLTVGFETNTSVDREGSMMLRLFPQVHIQLNQHVRIQLTAGMDLDESGAQPQVGTRLVLE